jgi:hypothetical protein
MPWCRAHPTHAVSDSRFADDDFTKAALREHHVVAADKCTLALGLSAIGGLLLLWKAKKYGCRAGWHSA